MKWKDMAAENMRALRSNAYPGRGIVLGRTLDGDPVQIYFVMGRSEGSRNRVLELIPDKPGWVRTRIADPSGFTGDQALLIYNAMAEDQGIHVVSNGAQTDAVIAKGTCILSCVWQYEPDSPNFTPRITGVIDYESGNELNMRLIMLRKSPFGEECDCLDYGYGNVPNGYGYFVSTYQGDGDPLPSFYGEPAIMPIGSNDRAEIAQIFWEALDQNNRVALAVKVIGRDLRSEVSIINRHLTS